MLFPLLFLSIWTWVSRYKLSIIFILTQTPENTFKEKLSTSSKSEDSSGIQTCPCGLTVWFGWVISGDWGLSPQWYLLRQLSLILVLHSWQQWPRQLIWARMPKGCPKGWCSVSIPPSPLSHLYSPHLLAEWFQFLSLWWPWGISRIDHADIICDLPC